MSPFPHWECTPNKKQEKSIKFVSLLTNAFPTTLPFLPAPHCHLRLTRLARMTRGRFKLLWAGSGGVRRGGAGLAALGAGPTLRVHTS